MTVCMKKAAGGAEKNDYEDCVYEGYGPNGVAVIVECLTDNRNRTAGEIRHYFDKFGGNMGATGCVDRSCSTLKGVIVLDNEDGDHRRGQGNGGYPRSRRRRFQL